MSDEPYPDPDDVPTVDVSAIPYFDRLEADLVSAAARHGEADGRRPSRRRPTLVPAAAAVLAALAMAATVVLAVRGDGADAVTVSRDGGEVIIEFDRVVDDPERLRDELADEGIAAAVLDGLAAPELWGRVVLVAAVTDDDIDFEDRDGDGSVDVITLPAGWSGMLELVVGRDRADSAAGFAARPAGCDDIVGATVEASSSRIAALSDDVIWQRDTVPLDGRFRELPAEEVPGDDTVVDLLVEPDGTLRVVVSPVPDDIVLAAPPCGP